MTTVYKSSGHRRHAYSFEIFNLASLTWLVGWLQGKIMRHYLVKKGKLKGNIVIPPSKSHTLRAILFGTLGRGRSLVHNPLASPDAEAMIQACRLLGATVDILDNSLIIQGTKGKINQAEDVIHAGNSGLVLRFCSAVGALASHPVVITGDHSVRHSRPMLPLLSALSQLGVSALSMRGDGYAPVIIQGPIRPGKAIFSGEDSQPVSALLIASAFAEGPIELHVQNPGEKPWISLTLDWLNRLGIPYENSDFQHYRLNGRTSYEGFEYCVPGDFSSAAFPLAAALITRSELTLHNLDFEDSQGDKELLSIFKKMGANLEVDKQRKTVVVKKGPSLSGIKIDINNIIDSLTILAVVACFAEGETWIHNGAIAKHKECNRIQGIAAELRKMGGSITECDDGLRIRPSSLKGAAVHSYHDHRMAMSLAIAGLGAQGETLIYPIECVAKTYPNFAQDLNSLGACIEEKV